MSTTSKTTPLWLDRALLFGRNFFKHPKMLGSLIPSSRFLVNRLLQQIDWEAAEVIVEYGPGVGVFTTEILRRMRPNATLVAIETNADFVDFLRRSVHDSRLQVVHGSAADIAGILSELGLTQADYIISGIPYSTMPPQVRDAILSASRMVLSSKGRFLVYQFSRVARPFLQREFRRVKPDFEPLNIPPASLFYCTP